MGIEFNLEFVMWITGHDRETVLQMHNDWLKSSTASRDSCQSAVPSDLEIHKGAVRMMTVYDEIDTRSFKIGAKWAIVKITEQGIDV